MSDRTSQPAALDAGGPATSEEVARLRQEVERLRADKAHLDDQVKLLVRIENRLHQFQLQREQEIHRIEALNRFALAASRTTVTAAIHELALDLLMSVYDFEQALGFRRISEQQLAPCTVRALPGREGRVEPWIELGQRAVTLEGLCGDPVLFRDEGLDGQPPAVRAMAAQLVELFGEPEGSSGAAWLCLPLRGLHDAPIGALLLRRPRPEQRSFHERLPDVLDQPYLQLVGAHVAAAAQNALLADIKKAHAFKVLEAQEQERSRVARELHDAIGQMLVAMRMDADWVISHATDVEAVRRVGGQLSTRLEDTIVAIRRIVQNLRPPILDDLGVSSALKAHVERVTRLAPIHFEIELDPDSSQLPGEVATAIYRIAQESINNVLRHSRAASARVSLEDTGRVVRLIVADDGAGIPAERIEAPNSLGLVGIRERAALLGGELTIDSAPGAGTTLRVEIPYRP